MVIITDSWSHKETTLQQRIAAHEKFSKYEINDWILNRIKLRSYDTVLDIGCGNGKQLIDYAKCVRSSGTAIGIDLSKDLIQETVTNIRQNDLKNASAFQWDVNNKLPFGDNTFDVISCCFSIYYYTDIQKVVSDIYRVMQEDGRFFVAAPNYNNMPEIMARWPFKQPRIERTECKIIPIICDQFKTVEIQVFKNPIEFPSVNDFMDYFSSTLVYTEMNSDMQSQVVNEVTDLIKKDGQITVTKHVYGILAKK